jgi:hypothetical protein
MLRVQNTLHLVFELPRNRPTLEEAEAGECGAFAVHAQHSSCPKKISATSFSGFCHVSKTARSYLVK